MAPLQDELPSGSHAHQLRRPANGSASWTAGDRKKIGHSDQRHAHTPEKPAAETVEDHQGPRSETRINPPAKVGDPQAQQVENRPVERDTRIPRS